MGRTGVMVCGHGSRDQAACDEFRHVVGRIAATLPEWPVEMGYLGPQGRSPVTLVINTDDCDAMFARAVAEGAKVEREPKTQFYGDRTAGVIDPFGHTWYMSAHVEDVSEEEMQRRMAAQSKQ